GAATQANSAAEAMSMGWGIDHLYSGIAMAILVGLVIIGGLKSLSTVTTYIVPFMAIFYIVGSAFVLVTNASMIPEVVSRALHLAFNNPMETLPGALAGWGVKEAVQRGIARGVFSNEAGMGSAPMVHATANVEHPVQQGFYGIFEVFMDTIVICTMTALVVMVTGTLTNSPDLTGAQLTLKAFENALGTPGKYVLSVGLLLFAFTTILGWYWYAETAVTYLFGLWCKPLMKVLWIAMILVGAAGAQFIGSEGNQFLNNIWDISDTLNGLMALPNLIGLLILSVTLKRIVNDYDDRFGTPSDRILTPVQKVLIAKVQYIVMGVVAVSMGIIAFFAYSSLFAGLAIVLGLLTAYRRQTLLGFLAVILGIAAAAI
ncbi:MAG: alanine:cation symporter family protein, partial [Synergistaceae bacterium]|nr:alanine:cation symporter family protein [Synergistaceae bacterium]